MVTIRNSEFIRFADDNGAKKSVVRAELDIDSASDLPAADGIDGMLLFQGSIAWDISTGDFYGLQSDGTWKKQFGGGEEV